MRFTCFFLRVRCQILQHIFSSLLLRSRVFLVAITCFFHTIYYTIHHSSNQPKHFFLFFSILSVLSTGFSLFSGKSAHHPLGIKLQIVGKKTVVDWAMKDTIPSKQLSVELGTVSRKKMDEKHICNKSIDSTASLKSWIFCLMVNNSNNTNSIYLQTIIYILLCQCVALLLQLISIIYDFKKNTENLIHHHV